jgi:hypothetical protein
MASSEQAFARFGMWKKFRTGLKLTVVTKGGIPEILRGRISSLDEELCLVSFAVTATRSFRTIDFRGASFRVGECGVEAKRGEDCLTFEEVAVHSRKSRV